MGHPINGIEYLLAQWEWLRRESPFPFYAFFLFTEENDDFASFFQRHFEVLDDGYGNVCVVFALAPPPPCWSEGAGGRNYWRHYLANADAEIGYDRDAVIQAARYFSVPIGHLPTVVLLRDLRHSDTLTVRLGGLSEEEAAAFFHNLFGLFRTRYVRDWQLWRLRRLVDILPWNRMCDSTWLNRLVNQYREAGRRNVANQYNFTRRDLIAHDITYRVEFPQTVQETLISLQSELQRLSLEVGQLREEQREGFRSVNVRLERIQVVLQETIGRIEEFRGPFIARWVRVDEEAGTPEEISDARERLHAEFDEFLERQSRHLAERLYEMSDGELPEVMRPLQDLLEEESRTELVTAEMLWNHLADANTPFPIDFSVCGIGLWKALEVEANRTFVDALRVLHRICDPGIASMHQRVQTSGEIAEFGLFGPHRSRVPINSNRDGQLIGLSLGKVGGLLAWTLDNGS